MGRRGGGDFLKTSCSLVLVGWGSGNASLVPGGLLVAGWASPSASEPVALPPLHSGEGALWRDTQGQVAAAAAKASSWLHGTAQGCREVAKRSKRRKPAPLRGGGRRWGRGLRLDSVHLQAWWFSQKAPTTRPPLLRSRFPFPARQFP